MRFFERGEAQLGQAGDGSLREGLVGHVGQRLTTPEPERLPQRVAVTRRDELLEPLQVELTWSDPNQIPRRARLDPIRADRAAQPRNRLLQ